MFSFIEELYDHVVQKEGFPEELRNLVKEHIIPGLNERNVSLNKLNLTGLVETLHCTMLSMAEVVSDMKKEDIFICNPEEADLTEQEFVVKKMLEVKPVTYIYSFYKIMYDNPRKLGTKGSRYGAIICLAGLLAGNYVLEYQELKKKMPPLISDEITISFCKKGYENRFAHICDNHSLPVWMVTYDYFETTVLSEFKQEIINAYLDCDISDKIAEEDAERYCRIIREAYSDQISEPYSQYAKYEMSLYRAKNFAVSNLCKSYDISLLD